MKKRYLVATALMFAVPALLMAGGHAEGSEHYHSITGRDSDFFPRVFNFAIFVGLAYYLLAEPIRAFFKERKDKIAISLHEIEKRLQEAKDAQKSAEQELKESKKKAQEIIKDAELEIAVLKERFKKSQEKDLEALERAHKERLEMEERRVKREVVSAILDENITADDIPLTSSKVIENLAKKVA
jgi:F-type H+-transporting ATPase subunit b